MQCTKLYVSLWKTVEFRRLDSLRLETIYETSVIYVNSPKLILISSAVCTLSFGGDLVYRNEINLYQVLTIYNFSNCFLLMMTVENLKKHI